MAVLRLKCHALFLDLKVREIMVLIVLKMHTINTIYSDPMVDSANRKKTIVKHIATEKKQQTAASLGDNCTNCTLGIQGCATKDLSTSFGVYYIGHMIHLLTDIVAGLHVCY